ncbi:MAG TPA: ABC transporter permease [Pyrinomonadaceae bacterium]|nr:ABC transporter permease [Pyrinomonadaceae bacterium]
MRLPGRRRDDELDEEIRSHLRMAIRDRVERGETPERAEAAARREFGNVGLVKEVTRDMWGWGWWERLLQDVRYGLRFMRRGPGFTVVAVLTLALGIGANTAIFSVVDAVLLRKLPVREPDRLVLFRAVGGERFDIGAHNGSITRDSSGQTIKSSFPYQTYTRFREQPGALSEVFAFGTLSLNVNAFGQADAASGQAVSGNYYTALGVPAVVGRTLTDDDDNAAAAPVAVITYRYWHSRFGADPAVVGKQINLNNNAFTIVGVTPPGFNGALNVGTSPDVTIPIAWEAQIMAERSRMKNNMWWLRLMGRLKPGATTEEAQSQLSDLFQQSILEHRAARISQARAEGGEAPSPLDPNAPPRLAAFPGSQGETNTRLDYRLPLYTLFTGVGLVLLIACANVANLLLARAASRQREIAVRLALGAGRRRLIRQLLTESLLLATLGGAFGLLLAFWFKDGLLAVSDWGGQQMSALDVRLDLRVLVFTAALSWAAGILFGLVPAWRATRVDLAPALKDNFRSSSSSPRSLFTKALIVAQVAISLLLMIGAGLFLSTLVNLRRTDPGFDTSDLLLFDVEPGLSGYEKEPLANLYRQMSERIEAVPGVQSVTFSANPLLAQSATELAFYLPGANAAADGGTGPAGAVHVHQVRENFLGAMGIPLLGGRAFTAQDDGRAPKVAIVNQSFAKQYLPDGNPIGKRLGLEAAEAAGIEIVGLAPDAKYTSQRDEAPPTIYLPWGQQLSALRSATFEVRTSGDPSSYVTAIRRAVGEVDGNLPLKRIKTQAEQADETLAMERLFAKLFSLFGLLALVLAAVGLYGVLAWSVTQRTHEIGIRVALGASRGSVMKMVLRQGLTLTLLGVVLGLAGAAVVTKNLRSLSHMLYGIEPTDPTTFGVIAVFLMLVALVACYIPARRATKVDPLVALRYE